MTQQQHTCLVCQKSSSEVPLIAVEYQDRQYFICPQHFPILIHKPSQLAGVLPGAETFEGHEH